MKLYEYIESICQEPLSKYQKMFFEDVEQKLKNGHEISMPPRIGRTLNIQTIWAIEHGNDWRNASEFIGSNRKYRA